MNQQEKKMKEKFKKNLRNRAQNLEEMKPHNQTAFITVQRSTDFIENVLREWECATFVLQTITAMNDNGGRKRRCKSQQDEMKQKKSHEIDSLFFIYY